MSISSPALRSAHHLPQSGVRRPRSMTSSVCARTCPRSRCRLRTELLLSRCAKGFCRSWGARDSSKANIGDVEVLVVFCELDEKEFLLAESDGSIFTATRFDGHGAVLVLLDATIIRALFVPSMVVLFGRLSWWMPRSLTRLLAVKPSISSRRLGNPDASEEALLRRSVRRIEERNA